MHMTKGRKLIQAGDEQGALAEFLHAAEIDPGNEAAQQEIARLRRSRAKHRRRRRDQLPERAGTQRRDSTPWARRSSSSRISNEPLTLHMIEDSKVVYQAIGKAAGINVLFDPDYTSKRIQVDLTNVSLLDALRIVGTMSEHLLAPDHREHHLRGARTRRAKRTELDEQAVQTFYLTNAWQQNDLQRRADGLRNVLAQRQDLRRRQPERHRHARQLPTS